MQRPVLQLLFARVARVERIGGFGLSHGESFSEYQAIRIVAAYFTHLVVNLSCLKASCFDELCSLGPRPLLLRMKEYII